MNLKNMISGTDIRGIVSKYEDKDINLSEKEVEFIAKGFGLWITEKYDEIAKAENRKVKVAVGYDARHTGPKFSEVIRKTLMEMGIDIYDCGMSITPSLFMATIFEDYKADGAMMITASHLPIYYNGIKFFTKNGGLQKRDVNEFLEMAEKQEENLIKEEKGVEIVKNLADDYASYICELIKNKIGKGNKPLENLRIVIDAGNGAAGFFAEKVIEVLGGDTAGSQFLNPDGNFPNHVPNPEAKEAIETSGHAAFKKNYFLDDGAYMAARLLIQLVESREKGIEFTDVLNELSEPAEEIEIRIPIKDKDFRARGEKIVENFREYAGKKEGWSLEMPNYEGVRVNAGQKSWFLIRLSLHEPLLCVNIEAEKEGMGNEILEELKDYFKKYEKMEI